tara:strand:+ start:1075 stop:1992 length:918 start_codon:yes stop_codon:yes gene_type:complete
MHLVITDSGLGGLSVCAKLLHLLDEAKISKTDFSKINLKITYINISPSNERGFNDMSKIVEQISTFKKILKNIDNLFSPDLIFLACGTLSGLLKKIQLNKKISTKIVDIVPIGNKLLLNSIYENPKSNIIIFGTPTTIKSKVFQNQLLNKGILKERIFSQSCPKLASKISNDLKGEEVSILIKKFVKKSIKHIAPNFSSHLIVFLACTHYPYRADFFYNSFRLEGYNNLNILSPNFESALFLRDSIFKYNGKTILNSNKISIKFASPYPIPEQEKKTISKLLYLDSEDTVLALKNEIVTPELLKD